MLFFTWHGKYERKGRKWYIFHLPSRFCLWIFAHLTIILLYTIYVYTYDFATARSCTRLCSRVVALREILPEHGKDSNSLFQAGLHWQKIKPHADMILRAPGHWDVSVSYMHACMHSRTLEN